MNPRLRAVVLLFAAALSAGAVATQAGPHSNTDAVLAIHLTGKVKNFGCAPTQANPTQNCLAVLPADYIVNDNSGPNGGLGGMPCSGIGNNCNNGWAWLMVANMDQAGGIAGISCGIDWQMISASNSYAAMDVQWTRCGMLEFPSGGWPQPGGGNRITWTHVTCPRRQPMNGKVTACAGWFYVTSYNNYLIDNAYIRVTPNYNVPIPELAVADCQAVETQLLHSRAGWAAWNVGGCPGPGCLVPGCNPLNGPCGWVAVEKITWGRLKQQFGK